LLNSYRFKKKPKKEGDGSIAQIFKEFIAKYPWHFSVLLFVLIIEGIVAAISVLAVVPLADFLLDPNLKAPSTLTEVLLKIVRPHGIMPSYWFFGIIFLASIFIKGVLDIATRYIIVHTKYALQRELFSGTLNVFFQARWEFFGNADQGKLLNTFGRELTNISETLGQLASQLARLIQLTIYLGVPLWLNASMTLMALSIAFVIGSPIIFFNKLGYRLGQKNTTSSNELTSSVSEVISAARLILGFGRQVYSLNRCTRAFDGHVQNTIRVQTLDSAIQSLYQPIAVFAAIASLGVALNQGGQMAELTALLWSLLRALPQLGALMSANVSIQSLLPSYEQLTSLNAQAIDLKEVVGTKEFIHLKNGVDLVDVDFTYPGRYATLQSLTLSIRKGEITALVGESGSGKSTVSDLILGLQIPNKGSVLIDGVALDQWRQNSFRERVGYVPQDPLLFHASVRENMHWSSPKASDDDIWAALRMANAEAFVKQLPETINTVVGERGVRLSGGQRQRIALARALLRKPDLLILDEATSSLDSESEKLIQESIENIAQDTTILIIAHRLTTVAKSDYVYVLQNGSVVEQGVYTKLCENENSLLGHMVRAQR
jgi:ABC-type multidrug transport system fused ATPase/permease subunit